MIDQRLAYTISEFCQMAGFSRAMFYKLRNQGDGPRMVRVGSKPMIAHDDAVYWINHRPVVTVRGQPYNPGAI